MPVSGNVLINTYYHLEFLHEPGSWRDDYLSTKEAFEARYARRINRFRSLRDFKGKVFFIRVAYPLEDPHRCFRFGENIVISEEYAVKLFKALESYFPKLDFSLLVWNFYPHDGDYVIKRPISENIWMIEGPQQIASYLQYEPHLHDLIEGRTLAKFNSPLVFSK